MPFDWYRTISCFCVFIDTAGFVDTLYTWSALNTEEIGNAIADSLRLLIETYPIENIHLIGHSLGAHSMLIYQIIINNPMKSNNNLSSISYRFSWSKFVIQNG